MANKIPVGFGSDPEFMVRHRESGKFVSAIPLLRHSKEDKIQLGWHNDAKLFYDNVLAEVNIPPASMIDTFVGNAQSTFRDAAMKLGPDYELVARSGHIFDVKECKHRDAITFGCDAEYDAWDLNEQGRVRRIVAPQSTDSFRSGGGHIHVAHPKAVIAKNGDPISLIRMMDLFVGVPAVLINHDPTAITRTRLYGRPGSHRVTDYGIEYRVLSNFWLASPTLVHIILGLTNLATQYFENYARDFVTTNASEEEIKLAIGGDKEMAANITNRIRRHIPGHLRDGLQTLMQPRGYNLYDEWGINVEELKAIDELLQASA